MDRTAGAAQCQTTTASSSWSGTFDSAERITNTGYTYDNLGRTRTTPASDTTADATGPLTSTYFANDRLASLSQSVLVSGASVAKSITYQLDPGSRQTSETVTSGGSEAQRTRSHYSSDTDSPSTIEYSTNAGQTWQSQRNVAIPCLGLVATDTGGTPTLDLTDLSADVIGTAPDSAGSTLASYSGSFPEYGSTTSVTSTPAGYGWLGTYQRESAPLGGIILMGARAYNVTTGLFAQPDPVREGGATIYGYPFDPVNQADLTGKWWSWRDIAWKVFVGVKWAVDVALNGACVGAGFLIPICGAVVGGVLEMLSYGMHALIYGTSFTTGGLVHAGAVGFVMGFAIGMLGGIPAEKFVRWLLGPGKRMINLARVVLERFGVNYGFTVAFDDLSNWIIAHVRQVMYAVTS